MMIDKFQNDEDLNNSVELDVKSVESESLSPVNSDDLNKKVIIEDEGDKSPVIVEEEEKDKEFDDVNEIPFIKECE